MDHKHVHIVCFTVPWPVIHGGIVDLFCKIEALHKAGVQIHLHCFGKQPQPLLNRYCAEVNYYPRKKSFSLAVPYIVYSRRNDKLEARLMEDNFPILLEGIHCTSMLTNPRFLNRRIIVRLFNVEHLYYRKLFETSFSVLRKLYYRYESALLRNYEQKIAAPPFLKLTISEEDKGVYERVLQAGNVKNLPLFTENIRVETPSGTGCFCLYHGNLSVPENERAVIWLAGEVFSRLQLPLVIAGRNPPARLVGELKNREIMLVANPADAVLHDLIAKAQCHVLPSFNITGVKLKLINALFKGRHCIVNTNAVRGSGLDELCTIADEASDFAQAVAQKFGQPLPEQDIVKRKEVLETMFDNSRNARRLIELLW